MSDGAPTATRTAAVLVLYRPAAPPLALIRQLRQSVAVVVVVDNDEAPDPALHRAVEALGGQLIANAPHMPVHLGSMGASVRAVRARHPTLRPGEAFALNNPYAGGTHLPDITVVMPVFGVGEAAEPAFFVAARGHHADVGGVQPGSMPPFSRTIDEEGVMLDALPVMRGGRFLGEEVRTALGAEPWPARSPDRNIADLKAQIAACQAGGEAVMAMIRASGDQAVARYMRFVQANAEACVRRAVKSLKDGSAVMPMDGGGEIRVAITVDAAEGRAVLDFSGSSGQLPNNFNAPSAIVDAAALYVFRTLVDDDIPMNAGVLKPLKVIIPAGCMLALESRSFRQLPYDEHHRTDHA